MWIRRNEFEKLVKRVSDLEQNLADLSVPRVTAVTEYDPYGLGSYERTWEMRPFRDVVKALITHAKIKYKTGTKGEFV